MCSLISIWVLLLFIVVGVKDRVWTDISIELKGEKSAGGIRIFTVRHEKEIFDAEHASAININDNGDKTNPDLHEDTHDNAEDSFETVTNNGDESSNEDDDVASQSFTVTISNTEWQLMKPIRQAYNRNEKKRTAVRVYNVLPQKEWTPIIRSHFWDHTRLPCCLRFSKALVDPLCTEYYVQTKASCSICNASFIGVISAVPEENARVLMKCTYTGNFNSPHGPEEVAKTKGLQTARVTGIEKRNLLQAVVDENIAPTMYHTSQAKKLIFDNAPVRPANLPSVNAIRLMKSRLIRTKRLSEETQIAIEKLKRFPSMKSSIRETGCDPFYVIYCHPLQIQVYRSYCKTTLYPRIHFDATGSVVKAFNKLNGDRTKRIYLYEAIIFDETKNRSFRLWEMLSEAHDNVTIHNWMYRCSMTTRNNPPREIVTDRSTVILSAAVKAFTQYSSLAQYLKVCSQLIQGREVEIPSCLLKCDLAHHIRLIAKWTVFKTLNPLVRDILLRSLVHMVKCTQWSDICDVLKSIFIVTSNMTFGLGKISEEDEKMGKERVSVEHYKKNLVTLAATGHFDEELKLFIDENLKEIDVEVLDETITTINYKDDYIQSQVDKIHEGSKNFDVGVEPNVFYCPEIVPLIKDMMKTVCLWSAIMNPIFKYGCEVASTASNESSFNVTKNIFFKPGQLPMHADLFVEKHIEAIEGQTKIRNLDYHDNRNTSINELSENEVERNNTYETAAVEDTCIACKNGDYPSGSAHRCIRCGVAVHVFPECSLETPDSEEGYGQSRICTKCSKNKDITSIELSQSQITGEKSCFQEQLMQERNAREKWSRRSRKTKPVTVPDKRLSLLNISAKKRTNRLPLLKNGNRSDLCPLRLDKEFKQVIFNNTCAFDSIASLFMHSIVDSDDFKGELNHLREMNMFVNFVFKLTENNFHVSFYKDRAEIIRRCCSPTISILEQNIHLFSCECIIKPTLQHLLPDFWTYSVEKVCSRQMCRYTSDVGNYASVEVICNLRDIQQALHQMFVSPETEKGECKETSCIKKNISCLHMFVHPLPIPTENDNNESVEGRILEKTFSMDNYCSCKLSEIPYFIEVQGQVYKLRGAIAITANERATFKSVGHYVAYVKQECLNYWELYDDLAEKVRRVTNETIVFIETLLYTK